MLDLCLLLMHLSGVRTKSHNKKVIFPHLLSSLSPAVALCWGRLLVRLRLLVVLTDLEVTQLVRLLVWRHHPEPVTQVVLLQVLLCQVLQIPGRQRRVVFINSIFFLFEKRSISHQHCYNHWSFSTSRLTFWRTASQTWRWSCSSCVQPGRCYQDSPSFHWPLSSLWGRFPIEQSTVMH